MKTSTSLHPTQKKRCSLKGHYLPATLCWVGRMLWNVLLIMCPKSASSAPERIQMWPANVCKHLLLAHTTFTSVRDRFTQHIYFMLPFTPCIQQNLKIPQTKSPLELASKVKLWKRSIAFSWVLLSTGDDLSVQTSSFSPGQQDLSKMPPSKPQRSQETSNREWLCPAEEKVR